MKRCGLIGRGLSHSFSPVVHSLIGGYEYKLYPLEETELERFLTECELDGLNVTMPYKRTVMPYCSELTERARAVGCVNTMVRTPSGWIGDNTDYDGFLYTLGDNAETLCGRPVLVLGAGGASDAVCAVLKDCGADITVVSRRGRVTFNDLEKHRDVECIVNATPVGMYPGVEGSLIDLKNFPLCRLVIDVIYNPQRTMLLLQAQELGIRYRNGLSMLTAQAVKASERFLGKKSADGVTGRIIRNLTFKDTNIVLVGLPGCGKTTTAAILARLMGRKCYDIDRLIEEEQKMDIPRIFREKGEHVFRTLERAAVLRVGKSHGAVIATGGGVVENRENYAPLARNGIIVHLTRHGFLPAEGRPVTKRDGIDALDRRRTPLYRKWADMSVDGESAQSVAEKIMKELRGENTGD